VRYNVNLEAQEGETYADILAVAQHVEALGFDGLYRADHYAAVWSPEERGTTDAWATLAGLARETERITLGTMVTPTTFRPPANLAKVVATVAEMAGVVNGTPRVHLGLGTGWLEKEHTRYGFPFEDVAARFRRLEEHATIIRGLWGGGAEPFSFHGEFADLDDAIFLPSPSPQPRVIIGGTGRRKTVRLAARFADELNTPWATPDDVVTMKELVDAACDSEGRPHIPVSVSAAVILGESAGNFRACAGDLHARIGHGDLDDWLAEKRAGGWALGTPHEVAAHVSALAAAGAEAFTFMHMSPHDHGMLDLIMHEVIPAIDVGT
jgi:alkanesulfonate monooxygenase SsuD/methylene tetrahydromethanopterin reductase-like flavin-dependent oxidoreductase (luciferase family)|tara:strand:+ start:19380 stop:20348 length:969 start_codon:yes stop_codon:yes gene_type:complete